MKRHIAILVLFNVQLIVLWIVSYPVLAASGNSQPVITSETPSSKEQCEISSEALDAIYEATTKYVKRGSENFAAWELIQEAKKAGNFPECDSIRAKILAEKATQLILDKSKKDSETNQPPLPTHEERQGASTTTSKPMFPNCEFRVVPMPGAGLDPISSMLTYTVTFLPTHLTTSFAYLGAATSGTGGCERNYSYLSQYRFAAVNKDKLALDMARGSGEYINAMAFLQGCPVEIYDTYAQVVKRKFNHIFPQSETDPILIVTNLNTLVDKDPVLGGRCNIGI